MNELKIFEHPKFGRIRTIVEDGKTLFCGVDAANALGYKDTTNAIKRHCRGVAKLPVPCETRSMGPDRDKSRWEPGYERNGYALYPRGRPLPPGREI